MFRFSKEKGFAPALGENGYKFYPVDKMLEFFYQDYPEGRIVAEEPQLSPDNVGGRFVGRVSVYANAEEQLSNLPLISISARATYNEEMNYDVFDVATTAAISKAMRFLGYAPYLTEEDLSSMSVISEEEEVVEAQPQKPQEVKPKKTTTDKAPKKEAKKEEVVKETPKKADPVQEEPKEEVQVQLPIEEPVQEEVAVKEDTTQEDVVEEPVQEEVAVKEETAQEDVVEEAVQEEAIEKTTPEDLEVPQVLLDLFHDTEVSFGYDLEAAKELVAETEGMAQKQRNDMFIEFNKQNIPVGDQIYDVITSVYIEGLRQEMGENTTNAEIFEKHKDSFNFFRQQGMKKNSDFHKTASLEVALSVQLFDEE